MTSSLKTANLEQATSHALTTATWREHLEAVKAFAADATLNDFYEQHKDEAFWYEVWSKEGLNAKVCEIVDWWTENRINLAEAAKHVGRKLEPHDDPIVKKYGYCRFKSLSTKDVHFLADGPGVDREQQIMVFIALVDLGPHNGFPFRVSCGKIAFLEGRQGIMTPPTGGGEAIYCSLRI